MKVTVFMIIVGIIFLCIFVGLLTLIVRALLKYIHSKVSVKSTPAKKLPDTN